MHRPYAPRAADRAPLDIGPKVVQDTDGRIGVGSWMTGGDRGQCVAGRRLRSMWRAPVAICFTVFVAACGGDGGGPDQQRLAEAEQFRIDLVSVSGRQHLSITDYLAIRDEACGGAVNDSDALVEIGERWGLALDGSGQDVANMVWTSARNVCPEVFDEQDFTRGLPFSTTGGATGYGDSADINVSFLDLSVLLDEAVWSTDNGQAQLIGHSMLTAEQTVEHFRENLGESWRALHVVGPFGDSPRMWSLDLTDGTRSGAINVYDRVEPSTPPGAPPAVVVHIALVDEVYPRP